MGSRRLLVGASAFAFALASLFIAPAQAGVIADPVTSTVPLRWVEGFRNGDPVEGTEARFSADETGVAVEVDLVGLTPGNAYTFWFAIVNEPGNCLLPAFKDPAATCGLADVLVGANGGPQAATVLLASGFVAEADAETHNGFHGVDEVLPPESIALGNGELTNPLGAEYQIAAVIDHGPYDPEAFGETQLTTPTGGCDSFAGCDEPYATGARLDSPFRCIEFPGCYVIDPTSEAWLGGE